MKPTDCCEPTGVKELVEDAIRWASGPSGNITRQIELRLMTGERYRGTMTVPDGKYVQIRRRTDFREFKTYMIAFHAVKSVYMFETAE
ncbi:hypothetical protein [Thalassobius sp. I31.1]|uniref:hypothetical protein n=1 Tax=Thalassobius sp. I31.1 TaxID=2109912 RepID=UPI0013003B6E|nr:hypothetical protein [Thalassobius sp. I31.1]